MASTEQESLDRRDGDVRRTARCSYCEPVPANLKCFSCSDAVHDAIMCVFCQTLYCSSCLLDAAEQCGRCGRILYVDETRREMVRPPIVSDLADALRVYCSHRQAAACDWTGERRHLKDHLQSQCAKRQHAGLWFLSKFGSRGVNDGELDRLYGVAIDHHAEGRRIVVDTWNHRVQVFAQDGTFLFRFGSFGSGAGQFHLPCGVAVDSDGTIVVSDRDNRRVQVFTRAGEYLFEFGASDGMVQPYGVAIDRERRAIVVVDQHNHRVQVFSREGKLLLQFGSHGAGDGQFNLPLAVALDRDGAIVVSDTGNNRVQVFARDGTFLGKFGSQGTEDGQLSSPVGIAVNELGQLVVVDANNHRVQVFARDGTFLGKFGSQGTGDGQFDLPIGLAVVGDLVFVTDYNNHRVQVLSSSMIVA